MLILSYFLWNLEKVSGYLWNAFLSHTGLTLFPTCVNVLVYKWDALAQNLSKLVPGKLFVRTIKKLNHTCDWILVDREGIDTINKGTWLIRHTYNK